MSDNPVDTALLSKLLAEGCALLKEAHAELTEALALLREVNAWKTQAGKAVDRDDLWQRCDALLARHETHETQEETQ